MSRVSVRLGSWAVVVLAWVLLAAVAPVNAATPPTVNGSRDPSSAPEVCVKGGGGGGGGGGGSLQLDFPAVQVDEWVWAEVFVPAGATITLRGAGTVRGSEATTFKLTEADAATVMVTSYGSHGYPWGVLWFPWDRSVSWINDGHHGGDGSSRSMLIAASFAAEVVTSESHFVVSPSLSTGTSGCGGCDRAGFSNVSAMAADPVNTATGGFTTSGTGLDGGAYGLSLRPVYNSVRCPSINLAGRYDIDKGHSTMFSEGWTSSLDEALRMDVSDGSMVYRTPDGAIYPVDATRHEAQTGGSTTHYYFEPATDAMPDELHATLTWNNTTTPASDIRYTMTFASGATRVFDGYGHLVSKSNGRGESATVCWATLSSGVIMPAKVRPSTVGCTASTSPYELVVSDANADGLIDSAAAGDGTTLNFQYLAEHLRSDSYLHGSTESGTPLVQAEAGTGTAGYSGDGQFARSAQLNAPAGMSYDPAGNLYVADKSNNVVRRIGTDGVISTVAGDQSAGAGFSGDDGPATDAQLNAPSAVAFDRFSNMYIADTGNQRIRKVARTGVITTVAGTGTAGDTIPATAQALNLPHRVVADGSGNIYIADGTNHRIRKVDSSGNITTIAGTGVAGSDGDGGPAVDASINQPHGIARDSSGNLFIAEGSRLRVVSAVTATQYGVSMAAGNIYTIAGTATAGFNSDGSPATAKNLDHPRAVAVDPSGNVYVADGWNRRVRKIDTAGGITTIAGTGTAGSSGDGGPATSATLNQPWGVALDSNGNVLIADIDSHNVRLVAAAPGTYWGVTFTNAGDIGTIAGTGTAGYTGDGSAATSATLRHPTDVVPNGTTLAIADLDNNVVRQVDSSGVITTLTGGSPTSNGGFVDGSASTARFGLPEGLFKAGSDLFISERGNHAVRKLTSGTVSTVAGVKDGNHGVQGEGSLAGESELDTPTGVAADEWGVFVADTNNHRIRYVDTNGFVTDYAGSGQQGDTNADGKAQKAKLNGPQGLGWDATQPVASHRKLYVADTGNHRVKVVNTETRTIAAVAGTGSACSTSTSACGDGGAATSAQLASPAAVTADQFGDVYIADTANNKIRKIVIGTGAISTIVGTGTGGFNGDDRDPTTATLNAPTGVAAEDSGVVHFSDTGNHRVRYDATVAGHRYYTGQPPFDSIVRAEHTIGLTAGATAGEPPRTDVVNTYDNYGRVTTQDVTNGDHLTFTYTGGDTEVTWCAGSNCETTTYTHDTLARATAMEDTLGSATARTWDGVLTTSFTERAPASGGPAATSAVEYDAQGRLVASAQPDPTTGFVPPRSGDPNCNRSAVSGHTYYSFPAPGSGGCTTANGKGGYSVDTYTYCTDEAGAFDPRVATATNAAGQVTRYYYDHPGGTAATDGSPCPDTPAVTFTPSRVKDPAGAVTAVATARDGSGNDLGLVTSVAAPTATGKDPITTTTYWNTSTRLKIAEGIGTSLTYYGYDALGRLVVTRNPAGEETWTRYDARGRVVDQIGPVAGGTRSCSTSLTTSDTASNGCGFPSTPDRDGPTVHNTYRLDDLLESTRQQANAADTTSPIVSTYTASYLSSSTGDPCTPPAAGCVLEETTTDPAHGYDPANPTATTNTVTTTRYNESGQPVTTKTSDATSGSQTATVTTNYGPLGRVASVQSAEGVTTYNLYDNTGNQCATATASFTSTATCTNPTVASGGTVTSRTFYDLRGRVIETRGAAVTDESSATVATCAHTTYDALGRAVQLDVGAAPTSGLGCVGSGSTKLATVKSWYDAAGNKTYSVAHDAASGTTITDPTSCSGTPVENTADRVTQTTYDLGGRPTHVYDSPVDVDSYGWCSRNAHYVAAYDTNNAPIITANVAPRDTRTEYDYEYPSYASPNVAGRVLYRTPPSTTYLGVTKTLYDVNGRAVENQIVAKGANPSADTVKTYTKTYYDTAGRAVGTGAPSPTYSGEARTVTCYDPYGRVAYESDSHTDPAACATSAPYFESGTPTNQFRSYEYWPNGQLRYVWSALRTSLGSNADYAKTAYFYDTRGNRNARVAHTQPKTGAAYHQITETWAFNRDSQPTAYTDPSQYGQTTPLQTTWAYYTPSQTSAGQIPGLLHTITTPTGRTVEATYRPDGRLDTQTFHDPNSGADPDVTHTYRYNAAGTTTSYADTTSSTTHTTTLTYNGFGELTQQVTPNLGDNTTATIAWAYDNAGNIAQLYYPTGAHYVYEHNATGLITRTKAYTGPNPNQCCVALADQTYTAWGALAQQNNIGASSSQYRRYSYHSSGATQIWKYSETITDTPSNVTSQAVFGYNEDGRIACETPNALLSACSQTNAATMNYTYDDAGQLTAATPVGGNPPTGAVYLGYAYTYSTRGQRLTQATSVTSHVTSGTPTPVTTTTYNTYNDAAELCTTSTSTTPDCTTTTNPSGATTTAYTYDTDGRRTNETTDDGTNTTTRTVTYDPRGKPATTTNATNSTTTNTETRAYNATGNLVRVADTNNGAGDLTWDNNRAFGGPAQILDVYLGSNTHIRANYGSDRISYNPGTGPIYYAYDPHGNVLPTSNINAANNYDPYGTGYDNTGTTFTNPGLAFSYHGELAINDQIHLRAREYHQQTGQFVSRDQSDGKDGSATVANLYHYADNDPLNQVDPLGTSPVGDSSLQLGQRVSAPYFGLWCEAWHTYRNCPPDNFQRRTVDIFGIRTRAMGRGLALCVWTGDYCRTGEELDGKTRDEATAQAHAIRELSRLHNSWTSVFTNLDEYQTINDVYWEVDTGYGGRIDILVTRDPREVDLYEVKRWGTGNPFGQLDRYRGNLLRADEDYRLAKRKETNPFDLFWPDDDPPAPLRVSNGQQLVNWSVSWSDDAGEWWIAWGDPAGGVVWFDRQERQKQRQAAEAPRSFQCGCH